MRINQGATQTGLSLPETLLVVMLVSLLSLQAAPPFTAWLERMTLTATTQQIVTLLRHAQQLAISRHAAVSVNIAPGKNWCLALSDQPLCDCMSFDDCRVSDIAYQLSQTRLPLMLSSNRFTALRPLVFDGKSGSAFDSAGTVSLAGTNVATRIIISPLGRIRACAEQGALNGLSTC